jgi:hypothetical protein
MESLEAEHTEDNLDDAVRDIVVCAGPRDLEKLIDIATNLGNTTGHWVDPDRVGLAEELITRCIEKLKAQHPLPIFAAIKAKELPPDTQAETALETIKAKELPQDTPASETALEASTPVVATSVPASVSEAPSSDDQGRSLTGGMAATCNLDLGGVFGPFCNLKPFLEISNCRPHFPSCLLAFVPRCKEGPLPLTSPVLTQDPLQLEISKRGFKLQDGSSTPPESKLQVATREMLYKQNTPESKLQGGSAAT